MDTLKTVKTLCFAGVLIGQLISTTVIAGEHCPDYDPARKEVFWGDLHVHSGYSLDAWGYGTANTPRDAYAFARGGVMSLPGGQQISLRRPLDFMAVTDHAEWFNLMYACSDPLWSDHSYCRTLIEKNAPETGTEVFQEYVLPTVTEASPSATPLCTTDPVQCSRAHQEQWRRIQRQANQANDPCAFTTFIAFEWSATPNFSHNHRNVIFAGDRVSADALDYLRYPTPQALWHELARQCRPENDCDVLAIPHNTNMGDGKSFDVEVESPDDLALRAKYERLVEIHQEKGSSECLPEFGKTDEDCNFEIILTLNSRPTPAADFSQREWERMRGSYVRRLLLRGLSAYATSSDEVGQEAKNPLQLGIIGSTDNHAGSAGFVDEETWQGSVFGFGDFDRTMTRRSWNPGGLVAVWAEENTRSSLFAALKRREVYGTSGPRIRVRMAASAKRLRCEEAIPEHSIAMGGTLRSSEESPYFLVHAQYDRNPLTQIQIIKGQYRENKMLEEVAHVWQRQEGALDACVTWQDGDFDPDAPAFWYARVLEAPTPRWSAYHCRAAGRCDDYSMTNVSIQERAWTSPIWYLPKS